MGDAAKKRGVVIQLKPARSRRMRGHHVGHLVGRDERGMLVDYPHNPHGVLVARSTLPLENVLSSSAGTQPEQPRQVLLVFEQERPDSPIIVGVLEPTQLHVAKDSARTELAPTQIEARVDGRRVVLDAHDEIVLSCGEASITLRRNGRVVIRGAYVETRSRGVNRIKGGTVQIN